MQPFLSNLSILEPIELIANSMSSLGAKAEIYLRSWGVADVNYVALQMGLYNHDRERHFLGRYGYPKGLVELCLER